VKRSFAENVFAAIIGAAPENVNGLRQAAKMRRKPVDPGAKFAFLLTETIVGLILMM